MESSGRDVSLGTTVGRFSREFFKVSTPDGRNVTLLESVRFKRPDSVGGATIELPAGTSCDLILTPAAHFWGGFSPTGLWFKAAFLHSAIFAGKTNPTIGSFNLANTIFLEALLASGVPEILAHWFYSGVSAGSRGMWDKSRTEFRAAEAAERQTR